MRKISYMAPEMEIVDLKMHTTLLAGSIDVGGGDQPPVSDEPGNGDDQI